MTEIVQPASKPPVIMLANAAVTPAQLTRMEADHPGLACHDGFDQGIAGLMQVVDTLETFGPLKGHRSSRAETATSHPWFGAELTQPKRLRERLAQSLISHMAMPDSPEQRPVLVSRTVFWSWEDCEKFAAFLMAGHPKARLLLAKANGPLAAERFAESSGWRLDAAENALAAMAKLCDPLTERFGPAFCVWTVPDDPEEPTDADVISWLAEDV